MKTYLGRSIFLMALITLTVISGGLLAASLTRSLLSAADLLLSGGAPRVLASLFGTAVMYWFDWICSWIHFITLFIRFLMHPFCGLFLRNRCVRCSHLRLRWGRVELIRIGGCRGFSLCDNHCIIGLVDIRGTLIARQDVLLLHKLILDWISRSYNFLWAPKILYVATPLAGRLPLCIVMAIFLRDWVGCSLALGSSTVCCLVETCLGLHRVWPRSVRLWGHESHISLRSSRAWSLSWIALVTSKCILLGRWTWCGFLRVAGYAEAFMVWTSVLLAWGVCHIWHLYLLKLGQAILLLVRVWVERRSGLATWLVAIKLLLSIVTIFQKFLTLALLA